MLAKMASSKSTIKEVDRTSLFFNKFCYRTVVSAPDTIWVQKSKTVDDYLGRIKDRYEVWNSEKNRYASSWYREPTNPKDIDKARVEKIISLVNANKDKAQVKYRCEGNNMQVFCNDLNLATEFAKFAKNNLITKVNLSPDGIMYFKKEPPAKFRAYMTNHKAEPNFKEEFLEYLGKNQDVQPSSAFYAYLHRGTRFAYQSYLWDKYYVDFNDDRNLMMMTLLFPGAIGKKFKLEKK